MEFWGVEVKAGETVKCEPGEERLLHLSHAALGETKNKGAENVPIYVKFNEQKLVIGTLSAEKCAQISYDLVFEKEFELSHGSKNASIYFTGYKTDLPEDDEFPSDFDESDSEEDVPVAQNAKGALKVKSQEEKPAKASSEAGKLTKAEPESGEEDDEDDSDFEDDDSEGSDDDVVMGDSVGNEVSDDDDDDDDDDDESSEEEEAEETPKKSANGKKRPAEAALKTSATGKKGDGKKGIPAKQSGKAQSNSDKPKQQIPKSAGTPTKFSKSFTTEKAPKKAKHGKGAK